MQDDSQAPLLDTFLLDALFQVSDSLYVGPEEGMTPDQWSAQRIPLPSPELPCHVPGWIGTTDLLDREQALAEHCAHLRRVAEAHGKAAALARPFPHFVVRPALIHSRRVLVSWPWTDTFPEVIQILEALATVADAAPGTVILDDEDQGWRLRIFKVGATILLAEWDGEDSPSAGSSWRVNAADLAGQASAALERLRTVHARLVRHVGRDLWS